MDTIVSALTGSKSAHPDYSGIMDTALSVREAVYKSIESGKAGKRAFVITSSSDRKQVDALAQRLHGYTHYMDAPESECVRRIRNHNDTPLSSGSIVTGRICYDAFVLDNKKIGIYYQATT